jgi:hypothetical protein
MAWTPKSAATLRFVFVAAALLAIVVVIVMAFRITVSHHLHSSFSILDFATLSMEQL